MKNILLFLIIISACTSEIEEVKPNSQLIITKVEWFDVDDDRLFKTYYYEYDKKQRLIAIKNNSGFNTIEYSYKDEKVISEYDFEKLTTYTYDNELIISSTNLYISNQVLITNTYEYNSLNQLISEKSFKNDVLICESNYTYNNIDNVKTEDNSCLGSAPFSFEYDNMKNRFSLHFNVGIHKIQRVGNNNQTKVYEGNKLNHTFKYEYNDLGYPISSTVSFGVREEITYDTKY